MKNEKTYPIKAVTQKTGLSVHVIRAWEKRYNAVKPQRTETNRRLYTETDVEKLSLLVKLTEWGHNIGSIASLSIKTLKEMILDAKGDTAFTRSDNPVQASNPQEFIDKCLEAINRFDAKMLEAAIFNASIVLSQPLLFEHVFIPLAKIVGDKWKSGELRIYQEHLFSRVVKAHLLETIEKNNLRDMSPNLVVAIPQHQAHEIGALIAAAYAASDGWKVTYLSPNLPAEEIIAGSIKLDAKVIVISIVYADDPLLIKKDLLRFGAALSKDTKIVVGGESAVLHKSTIDEIGGILADSFSDYRDIIAGLRQGYVN